MQKQRKQDQDGLYRRGDSSNWWLSYTDGSGQRVRCSSGTTDRREAEALLAKRRLEAHQQRHWDAQPARIEWEWDVPNPVAGRKLKQPEGRVRWLTRAEADRLLEAARTGDPQAAHLEDFIRLALHTGCRRGELLNLEWSRIDLEQSLFYLHAEHTKTARRRSVPLNAVACAAIESRRNYRLDHGIVGPWVFSHRDGTRIGDVKKSFASACARAGIQDFRIHDLRHTCAAWLVTAGVPLTEVRDLLGHTTVRMTERYAHLAPDNVRAAVALLEH